MLPPGERFLKQKEIAELLSVDRHTLARIMRDDPDFPAPLPLSRGVVRYRLSDLARWLKMKQYAALNHRASPAG